MTSFDPDLRHRRSVRLRGYDYRQTGAYFVTICTAGRECLLGTCEDGAVALSRFGALVTQVWEGIPCHFPGVDLDAFVTMPNHVHGILIITAGPEGTACRAPTETGSDDPRRFGKPLSGSLGVIVASFKSAATRCINEIRQTPAGIVWQRNYYERVIRSETMLDAIRQYIVSNPLNWDRDEENPSQ